MICPKCKATTADGAAFCSSCAEFLGTLAPGSMVGGRHQVVRFLGKGGMGTVYEARDRVLDELIALKVLRPDPGGSDDLARRFRSEIKLARKVRHPNVCGIHEYGEDGRLQYISMELIEGDDLKGLIRQRGPLAGDDVYDVAIQIAEGLEAVHRQGIVHRDLKTSNIMRDRRGLIRLMDFGIARRASAEGTDMTATGLVVGTPEYMSPEQARGVRVDHRSDIYSFGVVLFEVCTGRVPFQGETPVATILKHLHEPAPLETGRMAGVPEPLLEVLRHTLAKDPEERYPRMGEVLAALRKARAAAGVAAPLPLPSAPASPTIRIVPTARPSAVPTTGMSPPSSEGRRPVPATRIEPRPVRQVGRRGRALWIGVAVVLVSVVTGILLAVSMRPRVAGGETPPPPQALSSLPENPGVTPEQPLRVDEADPAPTPAEARVARAPAAAADERGRRPTPEPAARKAVPAGPAPSPVSPTPIPVTLAPPPSAVPPAEPVAERGWLRVIVAPWARVSVDGKPIGTTPFAAPIELGVGTHVLSLEHPDFFPLKREVTVDPGQTARVEIDLAWEGFKRR